MRSSHSCEPDPSNPLIDRAPVKPFDPIACRTAVARSERQGRPDASRCDHAINALSDAGSAFGRRSLALDGSEHCGRLTARRDVCQRAHRGHVVGTRCAGARHMHGARRSSANSAVATLCDRDGILSVVGSRGRGGEALRDPRALVTRGHASRKRWRPACRLAEGRDGAHADHAGDMGGTSCQTRSRRRSVQAARQHPGWRCLAHANDRGIAIGVAQHARRSLRVPGAAGVSTQSMPIAGRCARRRAAHSDEFTRLLVAGPRPHHLSYGDGALPGVPSHDSGTSRRPPGTGFRAASHRDQLL
jgi:hypothetical protein